MTGALLLQSLWKSSALVSVGAFLALNLAGSRLCSLEFFQKYDPLQNSEPARAARAYNTDQFPEAVFLGSSLVNAALVNADPAFLTPALSRGGIECGAGGRRPPSMRHFNWAISGQHPSDAYYVTKTLLGGARKPKLVIYGLAPRDLMNNSLPTPASTETVRLFSRNWNVFTLPAATFVDVTDRATFSLNRILFQRDRRDCFVNMAKECLNNLLCAANPDSAASKASESSRATGNQSAPARGGAPARSLPAPEAKALPSCKSPGLETNGMKVPAGFVPTKEWTEKVQHVIYYVAYRPFNEEKYRGQLSFLDAIVEHCSRQEIALVLLKMPLREKDIAIMPDGLLERYNRDVDLVAKKYGACVVDMNREHKFDDGDFADLVHLSPAGAEIFRRQLVQALGRGDIARPVAFRGEPVR